ncbi:MAG: LemA family protein [Patescibacteria group bacterium]|nr:LemA family protein [Patescibacteria group bacterium]
MLLLKTLYNRRKKLTIKIVFLLMDAKIIIYIVLGGLGVLALWLVVIYNGLIIKRNRVEEAWSDIDVQLKRRYDLIPNLIETVKAFAKHESKVFKEVTEARTNAINAKTPCQHAQAENVLTNALKSVFAVAESYPDLKSSQNFLQLQDELSDAENKIQAARRFYNGNVRDFNIKLQIFPTNLIAETLKFKKRDFFEIADEKERKVPKVEF